MMKNTTTKMFPLQHTHTHTGKMKNEWKMLVRCFIHESCRAMMKTKEEPRRVREEIFMRLK